jgi:hypothetical protein
MKFFSQAWVAYACNPSYSGGRDQEDQGLKPSWANSSGDPILKKTHHKKGLMEWLKMYALSSSPGTAKKLNSSFMILGLNPRSGTCWAGVLPLESCLHPFCSLGVFLVLFLFSDRLLYFCLDWTHCDPPTSTSQIAEITGMHNHIQLVFEIEAH